MKRKLSFSWFALLLLGMIFSLLTFYAARDVGPVATVFVFVIGYAILCNRYRSLLRKINELSRLVKIDDLTGLPNDRSFREDLALNPVGLIVFDLDHFKSYNDTFGHPAGDDALQVLGGLFKTLPVLVIYRVGGDEFASIVFDKNLQVIERQAQTLREAIRNYAWRVQPLTASFGIAVIESGEDLNLLRNRADQALYNAKRKGGDCVCLYVEPGSS